MTSDFRVLRPGDFGGETWTLMSTSSYAHSWSASALPIESEQVSTHCQNRSARPWALQAAQQPRPPPMWWSRANWRVSAPN